MLARAESNPKAQTGFQIPPDAFAREIMRRTRTRRHCATIATAATETRKRSPRKPESPRPTMDTCVDSVQMHQAASAISRQVFSATI